MPTGAKDDSSLQKHADGSDSRDTAHKGGTSNGAATSQRIIR